MRAPPRCPFVLALAALAAASAPAQGVDEPAGQRVVITGSARERADADAPYAISTLDAQALRAAGPLINLSEAMARVPGINVNNRSNYAQDLQISSRGFGARAGFGVRGMRLYTDGIPATMPDGQGQVTHFDLAGAQRIEVLRGPFSVLYGNSSGGVIAVFGAGLERPGGEAAIDLGSFGLRQLRLAAGARLGPGLDLQVSAAAMESEGFRPHSAARRTLGNARLQWQDADNRVLVLLNAVDQPAQDPLGLSRAQFDTDPYQTTAQAAQFDTRKAASQTQAGARWQHQFERDGPLRETVLMVYGGQRAVTQWQAIAPAAQVPARSPGGVVDFDRRYGGGDAHLSWGWDGIDFVTGLSLESQTDARRGYENFIGSGAAQQLGVTGALRREEANTAATREVYAQLETELGRELTAVIGARSGRVTLVTQDAFLGNGDDSGRLRFGYTNPVAGLRWKAAPALTLHASVARGFESPTLNELAYRPDGGAGFNDGLLPQTSRQAELGAKWRVGAIELDATAFRVDTRDEIAVQSNSGGRSTFHNVGRTRRMGAELALDWRASAALRGHLALTALDARYRDDFLTCTSSPCPVANVAVAAGKRIAGTQPASAYADLAWRPWLPLATEMALEWRGVTRTAVNDVNSDFAAGGGIVNLRLSHRWQWASGQLDLLARANNLGDRRYAGSVIVNDANARFFETAPPRTFSIGLRLNQGW